MTALQPVQPLTYRSPLVARVAGALLVFALLWAQVLGLVHQVRHAPHLQAASAAHGLAHAVGHDTEAAVHGAGANLLAHILAPAGDAPECRLYDQLGLADTLPVLVALALPVPLVRLRAWPTQTPWQAATCLGFAARAPPVVR